jgi:hypothetical protein
MESKDILYSKGKNDECFTLDYGVEPILKYIPKGAVVWCPFDRSDSEFVKQISKQNTVVHSHIDTGQDFFKWEPKDHWDIIISNAPFTNKRKFFEKTLSFEKPFAMLSPILWLNDAAPKKLFKDKDLQLLMFDKRMKFMNNGEIQNKITFSTAYYCWNFLPKQIIMEELKIK